MTLNSLIDLGWLLLFVLCLAQLRGLTSGLARVQAQLAELLEAVDCDCDDGDGGEELPGSIPDALRSYCEERPTDTDALPCLNLDDAAEPDVESTLPSGIPSRAA